MWTQHYQQVKSVKNVYPSYFLFSLSFFIPGGCFLAIWHLFKPWFIITSDKRFFVHFPITCMHWKSYISWMFLCSCILLLTACVIAISPTKKNLKTYFPEQTGSETRYHNPEDILCFTLKHKSENPEDICINEEHLDNLRVTSDITQRAENFWPTGVDRWSQPWPREIAPNAGAE